MKKKKKDRSRSFESIVEFMGDSTNEPRGAVTFSATMITFQVNAMVHLSQRCLAAAVRSIIIA